MTATTLSQETKVRADGDVKARTANQTWATPSHGGLDDDQHTALVGKLYQLYGQSRERERAIATSGRPARWGIALVEAAIGYEWLLSGLNKILNGHFTAGLASTLRDAMKNNPNSWWVSLTQHLVVPHLHLFGPLVPIGELLIALGFFTGAALWVTGASARPEKRLLTFGVIGAVLASMLMTTNFYLMSGSTLPGLDPANAFNEGLSIDGLLTLIGAGLISAHISSLRSTHAASSTDASPSNVGSLRRAA